MSCSTSYNSTLARSASDVKPPTKRHVVAFVNGEPAMQRQQTMGVALLEHKPVAVIHRSQPLQYVQFDAFQLPASDMKESVTYMPTQGKKKVTVPLVHHYLVVMVDASSKFVWVRMLATPIVPNSSLLSFDRAKTSPPPVRAAAPTRDPI